MDRRRRFNPAALLPIDGTAPAPQPQPPTPDATPAAPTDIAATLTRARRGVAQALNQVVPPTCDFAVFTLDGVGRLEFTWRCRDPRLFGAQLRELAEKLDPQS